jgi:hypothetical protein
VYDVPVAGLTAVTVMLPADLVGDGNTITITARYESATSPASLGMNTDERPLALMVDAVRFVPSEP